MAVFGDDTTRYGSSPLSPEYGSLESWEGPNKAPDVVASCEREQNRTASRSSAHALPHMPNVAPASTMIVATAPNGARLRARAHGACFQLASAPMIRKRRFDPTFRVDGSCVSLRSDLGLDR
jgi:hypothetical protein